MKLKKIYVKYDKNSTIHDIYQSYTIQFDIKYNIFILTYFVQFQVLCMASDNKLGMVKLYSNSE